MASLSDDPRFQRNLQQLRMQTGGGVRVIDGVPVPAGELMDCVAVGCERGWKCTGTLIAPTIVISAAHCSACAKFVYFGEDVTSVRPGDTSHPSVVAVAHAAPHQSYVGTGNDLANDIMVLVLAKAVNVTPRRLATAAQIDAAQDGRVAGFGWVDPRGRQQHGRKCMVDVPIASNACDGTVNGRSDAEVYRCATSLELVAKPKDPLVKRTDTCRGDSGGPLYVLGPGGEWLLAGVTSRGVPARVACGDGGIYTRIDRFADWIKDQAEATV